MPAGSLPPLTSGHANQRMHTHGQASITQALQLSEDDRFLSRRMECNHLRLHVCRGRGREERGDGAREKEERERRKWRAKGEAQADKLPAVPSSDKLPAVPSSDMLPAVPRSDMRHRVSRPRDTGSVGDSVGEGSGLMRKAAGMHQCPDMLPSCPHLPASQPTDARGRGLGAYAQR
jgi:hypothetical protein